MQHTYINNNDCVSHYLKVFLALWQRPRECFALIAFIFTSKFTLTLFFVINQLQYNDFADNKRHT